MSLKVEATAALRDTERPKRVLPFLRAIPSVLVILVAIVMAVGLVVGTYLLFRDPSDLYALERQRVVDEIAQFHTQNGRYPNSLHEAGIVLDGFDCRHYEADEEFFFLEVSRARLLLPGRTTWSYNSQKGRWSCYSEPH
jgi:hypothetical protein